MAPENEVIEALLVAHQPAVEAPRVAFAAVLRAQFIAGWDARVSEADEAPKPQDQSVALGGSSAIRSAPTRLPVRGWFDRMTDRLGIHSPGSVLALAAGVAALVLLAVSAWPVGRAVSAPPPMVLADLVARNQRAWQAVRSLSGTFETADGGFYEEWVSWSGDGGLRFKRYAQLSRSGGAGGEWNISDGRTEWWIDAPTGRVLTAQPAPRGAPEGVRPDQPMQCAALVLPPDVARSGATPQPAVLDGRPVYRLIQPAADGSMQIYWIDARDALVYRIDRADGRVAWHRTNLDLNPALADDIFHPDNLAHLES